MWGFFLCRFQDSRFRNRRVRLNGILHDSDEITEEIVGHFLGCHVDCTRDDGATVIDAKVVGAYCKIDDVIALYTPQMIAQKACTKARSAALLVVVGGAEPVEYPVDWDDAYETALWQRVDAFWACVESLTPPFPLPAIAAPVKAEKVVDLTGSNSWAAEAACWLATKDAAKQFDAASKAIKALVPADAAKAHGYGVAATRNKAGSLSIREIAA